MVVGGGYWVYANGELNTNPGYPITTISNTIYQAFAYAVNDAGTIAGICESTYYYPWPCNFGPGAANGMQLASYDEQTAAIRDDGTSCGMGLLPPNYPDSFAIWAPGGTQTVNFVYNDNGKIPSEFESSFCSSLDNNGTAVGGFLSSFNTSNSALSVYGGLIYDPVNGGRDLNNLIAKPVSKLYSVYVYPAVGLSASGAIAANCRFKGPIEGIRDHACLLSPNWGNIVKGSILALAQGDPECIQCKTELVPEADSLPPNEDGLSAEEKRRAVETLEKIQVNLLKLGEADRNRISKDKIILLSHDTQEALVAFGYRLP
jgi:hypothetical protein